MNAGIVDGGSWLNCFLLECLRLGAQKVGQSLSTLCCEHVSLTEGYSAVSIDIKATHSEPNTPNQTSIQQLG